MAMRKKAKNLLARTTQVPEINVEVAPRIKGRPAGPEYVKVTVCLYPKQILFLDRLALSIREKTGTPLRRAKLIRALVDHAGKWISPDREDFNDAIQKLLPSL